MYYNFQFHGKIVHIFLFQRWWPKICSDLWHCFYTNISCGFIQINCQKWSSHDGSHCGKMISRIFKNLFGLLLYLTKCNFTNFCYLQVPKLDDNIRVKARMTFTQTYISAISYSKPMPKNLALDKKDFVENEAINVGFQFIFLREIENYTQ